MSSITEERQKILKKKLKEMGNYGVQVRTPEESPFYDQPTDYERELERMQIDEPEKQESHVQPLNGPSVERKAPEDIPGRKLRVKGNKKVRQQDSPLRNTETATLSAHQSAIVNPDLPSTVRSCSYSRMFFVMSVPRPPSPPTSRTFFLNI